MARVSEVQVVGQVVICQALWSGDIVALDEEGGLCVSTKLRLHDAGPALFNCSPIKLESAPLK